MTRFIRPGSIDFHHTIMVTQLRATVDVHIHSPSSGRTAKTSVSRWLVLDIAMPTTVRPLRKQITPGLTRDNVRTMAAVKDYAESLHKPISRTIRVALRAEASDAAGISAFLNHLELERHNSIRTQSR